MRNIILLMVGLLFVLDTQAQSPEKMSYQAVVRNATNNLVTNQGVGMQISILQTSASGTSVYVETHTPTTNANGLVSIEIGTGTVVSGAMSTIDWSAGPYFIKTETDPTGGTTYSITGTSQLMSVPYALHANKADSVINDQIDDADADPNNELQILTISNDTVYLSNSGFVKLPQDSFNVYTAGTGINITNNVVSIASSGELVCPSTITDARDGEVYSVVRIGNQCWLSDNMRYAAAGSFINPANPSKYYGRLYDWATVMNGSATSSTNPSGVQGVCPSGWHLPSDSEWNELELSLGMPAIDTANNGWRGEHGTYKLKSVMGWNSAGNGTNSSGFNAFPAGDYLSGSFYQLGDYAYFWSSTEYSGTNAWLRYLSYGGTRVNRNNFNKTYGYSCRCVKD